MRDEVVKSFLLRIFLLVLKQSTCFGLTGRSCCMIRQVKLQRLFLLEPRFDKLVFSNKDKNIRKHETQLIQLIKITRLNV